MVKGSPRVGPRAAAPVADWLRPPLPRNREEPAGFTTVLPSHWNLCLLQPRKYKPLLALYHSSVFIPLSLSYRQAEGESGIKILNLVVELIRTSGMCFNAKTEKLQYSSLVKLRK